MKKILFTIILCLMSSSALAQNSSLTKLDYVVYTGYTGVRFAIAWAPIPGANSYQFRVKHLERNQYIDVGITPLLRYEFTPQKSGHYICEVRSISEDQNHNIIYSSWASSINPLYATVDNLNRAWWFYLYVQPPGTPVITK